MALVHRPVTARMIEANRRNARRSTGPRTPAGKAQVRLNAVRHGRRSAILTDYFYLWYDAWMRGPWEPLPRWDPSKLPVPFLGHPGSGKWCRDGMREFLFSVAPYVRPWPRAARKGGEKKEFFFDVQSRQVIENKEGVGEKWRERTQNEAATKPEESRHSPPFILFRRFQSHRGDTM